MSLSETVSPSVSAHPPERLSPAQRVTAQIKAALERGVRPWTKPWDDGAPGFVLPRRSNGLAYRGVNVVALWAASVEHGFRSPFWFTFKQALAHDAAVRKGERGSYVVFYAEKKADAETADDGDDTNVRRILRGYSVFCADQIDGLPAHLYAPPPPPVPVDAREAELVALLERAGARVLHGGPRAYYDMAADLIRLPERASFRDAGSYLATRAHELGHWTRAPSRLDRDFGQKRFGDHGYALEELTAELCAAMLGAVLGFPGEHVEDHAAYIASWLSALDAMPSAFLSAAGKAQAATDYLLQRMGHEDAGPLESGAKPEMN
ncbi:MAG: ArdC family protein [Hyphomonadaceae bacterium]